MILVIHSPVHAGVAFQPEREHRYRQVPRPRRRISGAVGRHHASLHAYGCAAARHRVHAHYCGLPTLAAFGTGVCVSIPKGKWGVITPEDLENATPKIKEGDVVVINTGYHRLWADTDEYFAYGPGIYKPGAEWLVEKKVRMVAYGCQANDHPIATKLVNHGLGPTHPHLIEEYKAEYGRDPLEDFPEWEPAHKTLMIKGGIPGIENAGGDLDAVTGKRCTFMAFPWRWPGGWLHSTVAGDRRS